MKDMLAVPAESNSIECTPIGRISMSFTTISLIQIARKKSPPDSASSAEPSASIGRR